MGRPFPLQARLVALKGKPRGGKGFVFGFLAFYTPRESQCHHHGRGSPVSLISNVSTFYSSSTTATILGRHFPKVGFHQKEIMASKLHI